MLHQTDFIMLGFIERTKADEGRLCSTLVRNPGLDSDLHCIHTKKLSCLRSSVEFDMNDIFYEFKYLRHF